MNRANEPAYPVPDVIDHDRNFFQYGGSGLTIREHAAIAAMQGLLARTGRTHGEYSEADWQREKPQAEALWVAQAAARYANALIAELERTK